MGCGLVVGIIGPIALTAIVIYALVQDVKTWPLIFIAIISWSGVALAQKWRLIAGIFQIALCVALPFIFHAAILAIDPQGDLGAAFAFIIVIPICSLPLLISGIIIIISWIGER